MKKYRCTSPCWQLIAGRRHWEEGMIAEVSDDFKMPSMFELVGVEKYSEPVKEDVESFTTLQSKQKKSVRPKHGFASNIDKIEPEQR